jgi:hypothetical protein
MFYVKLEQNNNRIKLLFVFFIALFLSVSVSAQDNLLLKKLTLKTDSIEVSKIIDTISQLSGLSFSYNSDIIATNRLIAVNFENTSIENILNYIFQNEGLIYTQVENVLIISQPCLVQKVNDTTASRSEIKFIKVHGRVIDKLNQEPIVYANVYIPKARVGTIANSHGEFLLKIPIDYFTMNIEFSCLGYKDFNLPINDINCDFLTVQLEQNSVLLNEVVVKPVNPLELLRAMKDRISLNYSTNPMMLTAFFRESIARNNKYISITEMVLNIYKSSYQKSYPLDQASVYKGRRNQDLKAMESVNFSIQGGIYNSLQLDLVRNLEGLLSDENLDYYNYTYAGMVNYEGHLTYMIEFDQKDIVDFPLYKGQLYFDEESMALVAARFSISPKHIEDAYLYMVKKKPMYLQVRTLSADYFVNYKLNNGHWVLNSLGSNLVFRAKAKRKLFNSTYTAVSELAVTSIDTTNVHRFKASETVKPNDIAIDKVGSYDEDFWGMFNVIKPEESIEEAIRKLSAKMNKH